MSILSAALLLFLVIDPIGNIPLFLVTLKEMDHKRRKLIIIRELTIALGIMVLFLFSGKYILQFFYIKNTSLTIAGGIILFLIALKMIFPSKDGIFGDLPGGKPFIVPLAIPLIAGPSVLSTILFLSNRKPGRQEEWLLAIGIAWIFSITILLASEYLAKFLGKKGLIAIERLMGMILSAIAIQMTLNGIKQFLTN